MKKQVQYHLATLLAILTICCLTTASLSSQNAWGIRAGTNLAKIRSSDKDLLEGNKTSAGILVSVPLEFGIARKFAIQVEPSFIQKGFKNSLSETNNSNTYTSKMRMTTNYLELPVLAKFKFGSSKMAFNALLGPSLGYAASGRIKSTYTINGKTTDANEKLKFGKDEYPRIDFALNGGIGIGFGAFGFDVRYAWGLKNIFEDNGFKIYNNGLQLALSYMMPMRKNAAK